MKERIFKILDKQWDDYKKQHDQHKERVEKSIDWFTENIIQWAHTDKVDESGFMEVSFVMSHVEINWVDCVCVTHKFIGVPQFSASFEFRPFSQKDDAGNGAGNLISKQF